MGNNRTVRISAVLLAAGVILACTVDGLGFKEWAILIGFSLLGFGIGAMQAAALVWTRRGVIGRGMRTAIVALSFAVLFALKDAATVSIPSHLGNTGWPLLVQIFFSVFGLLFARGYLAAKLAERPGGRPD